MISSADGAMLAACNDSTGVIKAIEANGRAKPQRAERKMPKVHVFSLKVGSSHGLWQYKASGTHDRVMMHGLRQILDRTCRLLGYRHVDRSTVYLFYFSAEPFEGCQVCLEKMRMLADGSCRYRVTQSNIGALAASGLFPTIVRANYLGGWPERIYFKLETSMTGGIVN